MTKRSLWAWLIGGGLVALWLAALTKPGRLTVKQAEATVSSFLDNLRSLIARFEGLNLSAYLDTAGRWTIGYGHLIQPGDPYYPYGSVTDITPEQATSLLDSDTQTAQDCVNSAVTANLTDNQRAALVSFVFNVGCEAFTSSTMLTDINAGNFAAAAAEFAKWDHIHDPATGALVASAGLLDRRNAEAALFTGAA